MDASGESRLQGKTNSSRTGSFKELAAEALTDAIMAKVGELAYDAYRNKAGGLTYDGKPMPLWADLGDAVQSRWNAAGHIVSLFTIRAVGAVRKAGLV